MTDKLAIYDTDAAKNLSIKQLTAIFKDKNVTNIYFKALSPNDNSKNQPYMAGHLTDLSFIPTGEITESVSDSQKERGKRKIKYLVELNYSWVSSEGIVYPSPEAKLIYYPQYPEVRLSGFVARCGFDMGGWMDPAKKGRSLGRVLFFGVTAKREIIAYLATPGSRLSEEVNDTNSIAVTGLLNQLNAGDGKNRSSKIILLQKLKEIHNKNWIESQKLAKDGTTTRYLAQNGGGYTLEAELGISPNGYSDPDFLGWEVKQFSVARCDLMNSKALTLMTPEPDGGFYVEQGVEAFVRKYGYSNSKIADRFDFTGRHLSGVICPKTNLELVLDGFDKQTNIITNASGCIALRDTDGNLVSTWSFKKIMEHWQRKHAHAVYVPSRSRKELDNSKSYNYCNNIRLFEGTKFIKLLSAISKSHVYYDPGIKLENAGTTRPKTKRRSQFRIKSKLLEHLYDDQENVDLLSI